jgi:hypothetical protein
MQDYNRLKPLIYDHIQVPTNGEGDCLLENAFILAFYGLVMDSKFEILGLYSIKWKK